MCYVYNFFFSLRAIEKLTYKKKYGFFLSSLPDGDSLGSDLWLQY